MEKEKKVKLSIFAQQQGISYSTAYRYWKNGDLKGTQTSKKTILVSGWKDQNMALNTVPIPLPVLNAPHENNTIVYARVSSPNRKIEMKEQITNLLSFAEEKNFNVIDTVEEVALGFSDSRTKLLSVFYRNDWSILLVENKMNFMKFGLPYVEEMLRKNNQKIIALSDHIETENENERNIPLAGDQELFSLINRTRSVLKKMIGIGSARTTIEEPIQKLLS